MKTRKYRKKVTNMVPELAQKWSPSWLPKSMKHGFQEGVRGCATVRGKWLWGPLRAFGRIGNQPLGDWQTSPEIRDTPLVPEGTVADMYALIHLYVVVAPCMCIIQKRMRATPPPYPTLHS